MLSMLACIWAKLGFMPQTDGLRKNQKRSLMIDAVGKIAGHVEKKEGSLANRSCVEMLSIYADDLDLLPPDHQQRLLTLMMDPYCKPKVSLECQQMPNADRVKDALLDLIESSRDPVIKQNALMQSLCKGTALGQVFHVQRHQFMFFAHSPSVLSGRLKQIATRLMGMEINQATPGTKEALRNEVHRRFTFVPQLKRYFPSLYAKVEALDEEIIIGPKPRKAMIY